MVIDCIDILHIHLSKATTPPRVVAENEVSVSCTRAYCGNECSTAVLSSIPPPWQSSPCLLHLQIHSGLKTIAEAFMFSTTSLSRSVLIFALTLRGIMTITIPGRRRE